MNLDEAAELLGISPNADHDLIKRTYDSKVRKIQQRLAQVQTPAAEKSCHRHMAKLTQAKTVLLAAIDTETTTNVSVKPSSGFWKKSRIAWLSASVLGGFLILGTAAFYWPDNEAQTPEPEHLSIKNDLLYQQGVQQLNAKQYASAQELLTASAEAGNDRAQIQLAWMLWDGVLKPANHAGAKQQMQTLFEGNSTHGGAANSLGVIAMYEERWQDALNYYAVAVERGNQTAACNLGQLYSGHPQFTPDYPKAYEYFQKGGNQTDCLRGLARLHHHGRGTEKNYAQALIHYQKAAENGDPESTLALARLLTEGENGFAAQPDQALPWAQKAAEQKQPYGQYLYGRLLLSENPEQAEALLKSAWAEGIKPASFYLGQIYSQDLYKITARGGWVTENDYTRPLQWYQNALPYHPNALREMGRVYLHAGQLEKARETLEQAIFSGDRSALGVLREVQQKAEDRLAQEAEAERLAQEKIEAMEAELMQLSDEQERCLLLLEDINQDVESLKNKRADLQGELAGIKVDLNLRRGDYEQSLQQCDYERRNRIAYGSGCSTAQFNQTLLDNAVQAHNRKAAQVNAVSRRIRSVENQWDDCEAVTYHKPAARAFCRDNDLRYACQTLR